MIPKIGDSVYGVHYADKRLVEIGKICNLLNLSDVDDNLWQVWFDKESGHYEFIDSTSWYESLQCWILDVEEAQALDLL